MLDFAATFPILPFMITPSQIRAARALLGISVDDLSAASGVASLTIVSVEADSGSDADAAAILALAEGLKQLGITFIADGDAPFGGAGVRRSSRRHEESDDGLRPEMLNASNDG